MFINNQGQVIVFGKNNHGQLGLGHTNTIKIPEILSFGQAINIISVSKGEYHTLFLTNEGEVYSCGFNCYGQLGLGHNNNIFIPNKIDFENKIIYICCGGSHSMCIDEHYNLYAFGCNNGGQLGLKHNNNVDFPIKCDIQTIEVFCGTYYTLIIDINNKIYVCGDNRFGPLRHNNNQWTELIFNYKVKDITCGYGRTLILTTEGNVYFFGCHNQDKLDPEKINIENIVKISSGDHHNLLLDLDGNVYSFGLSNHGQLGLTNKVGSNIPIKLEHKNLGSPKGIVPCVHVIDIFCYEDCSFIHDDKNVFCFGKNNSYDLGLGHNNSIIIPTLNPYLTDISHYKKRFMNTKSSRNVFNNILSL